MPGRNVAQAGTLAFWLGTPALHDWKKPCATFYGLGGLAATTSPRAQEV